MPAAPRGPATSSGLDAQRLAAPQWQPTHEGSLLGSGCSEDGRDYIQFLTATASFFQEFLPGVSARRYSVRQWGESTVSSKLPTVQLRWTNRRGAHLVFLNGLILGVHRNPHGLLHTMRQLRRAGVLREFVSVQVQRLLDYWTTRLLDNFTTLLLYNIVV